MRKIIANWKQNLTEAEINSWFNTFSSLVGNTELNVQVVISPTYIYLPLLSKLKNEFGNFAVCSQDVSIYPSGSHTGEVSAKQLTDFCDYVLVGHSERGETRAQVLDKIKNAREVGLLVFECFVKEEEISNRVDADTILIWEDKENISKNGVYNPKEPSLIEDSIKQLKSRFSEGREVLYGGSVNRGNAHELSKISVLDGVIVGNASLDPNHFFEIVMDFNL